MKKVTTHRGTGSYKIVPKSATWSKKKPPLPEHYTHSNMSKKRK